ncbi:hypothetical protein DESUT3_28500 [Desulfuromonas versatilis]|uniref:Tetratricopeptide repeat protein n=1 Tax=Desulfuromonas versatilis TaxID=2802975 RepID=A0ABN6E0F8_9BACT|nr:hypothetical protein [Desulfuromonas versatilis]BCR05781.1 hypothetical protein DESUT3_28500 [Desulfuromonas versatilis]
MASFGRILLLGILLTVPLFGGGDGHWSRMLAEVGGMGLLLLCLVRGRAGSTPFYGAPGLVPLGLLLLFAAMQLFPLPPLLLRLVSPATWRLYAETAWEVRPGAWMPISIEPRATLHAGLRILSWAAVYLAAVQLLASREQQRRVVTTLIYFLGALTLLGFAQLLYPSFALWGLLKSLAPAGVLSEVDQFAAFMALGACLSLGWYLAQKPRVTYLGFRGQLIDLFSMAPNRRQFFFGLVSLLALSGIFLAHRPLLLTITLAAALLVSLVLLARRVHRARALVVALFAALFLGATVFLHWGVGMGGPLATEAAFYSDPGRSTPRGDGLAILGHFPAAGTGWGTLPSVSDRFPLDSDGGGFALLRQGELGRVAAEGGLSGLLLAGFFLVEVFHQGAISWWRRKSRTSLCLYLGGAAGVVSLLVLGLLDRLPDSDALGLHLFFLLGFSVAVANTRSRSPEQDSDLPAMAPAKVSRGLVATALLLIFVAMVQGGDLAGRKIFLEKPAEREPGTLAEPAARSMLEAARQAARLAPLDSRYRYALADSYLDLEDNEQALGAFAEALRLAPLNGEYLQRIALVYDATGDADKAARLLLAGVTNDPRNAERHKVYALWLVAGKRVDEAVEQFHQAMALQPAKTGDYLMLMALSGLPEGKITQALPGHSTVWVNYADYLVGRGDQAGAEAGYLRATVLAGQEPTPEATSFWRLYEYYQDRNRSREALEALLAGIRALPESPQLRQAAALLYLQLGITYRAVEEFRNTLLLDPGNTVARQHLEELDADR